LPLSGAPEKLHFCNRFRYPAEVCRQLTLIAEIFRGFPILGVLLHGSTSRGELSVWRRRSGYLEIFSDYEFLVVAQSLTASQRTALSKSLTSVENTINACGPLNHIDVSFLTPLRAGLLPRIVQTFEVKERGLPFHGEDMRPLLPNVTLYNLDLRELNDILLWRLWAILFYFPMDWMLNRSLRQFDWRVRHVYVLCRNNLDLLTWALPYEGILLSSFRERYSYAHEHWHELGIASSFPEEFIAFQKLCLEVKADPNLAATLRPEFIFRKTLENFLTALNHLLKRSGGNLRNSSEDVF